MRNIKLRHEPIFKKQRRTKEQIQSCSYELSFHQIGREIISESKATEEKKLVTPETLQFMNEGEQSK